jgi:protein tyrosine/serine phosphatase
MQDRVIALEGVENFRDYGGYVGTDGLKLKPGRLLRSGHHARASEADLGRFQALGVGAIVDLRRAAERHEQPSRRYPGFSGAVIESSDTELVEAPHITFLKTTDLTEASARGFMLDTYRAMPFDARHLDLFSRYFRTLAESDGAVLIHCAAGKDRTGLLAALTHHALGVGEEDRMADYLLTNTAVRLTERAPEVGRRIAELYGRTPSDAAVIAFLGVEPAFLHTAWSEIIARYGSIDAYLEQALGVDAATREKIAVRLLA